MLQIPVEARGAIHAGTNGAADARKLEDVEREHIERVLRDCNGNHSQAARILDIDRTTLYSRLRKYGVR